MCVNIFFSCIALSHGMEADVNKRGFSYNAVTIKCRQVRTEELILWESDDRTECDFVFKIHLPHFFLTSPDYVSMKQLFLTREKKRFLITLNLNCIRRSVQYDQEYPLWSFVTQKLND